jgi:hypothetical protein
MRDWGERHGQNVKKLVAAIRRAADEHGTPNGFYPRELWLDYGAPHQLIIGQMMRNTYVRNIVEQQVGLGPVEYHTTTQGVRRISIGEEATS